MTTVAIIQARMGSTRLPGKVLASLGGRPALARVAEAAAAIPGVDRVVVATGEGAGDDPVAAWCAEGGIACRRGPEEDVLRRFALAARAEGADTVLRLTADCPLLDPTVCGEVLLLLERSGADYASNVSPPSWPDGLDCEAMTVESLLAADAEAERPSEREHVTLFIRNRPQRFRLVNLPCPVQGLARERWTLDRPEDLRFLDALAGALPAGPPPSYLAVLRLLDGRSDLRELDPAATRNEAARNAMTADGFGKRSYRASVEALARAEAVIPLGSQTFSKSRVQYPVGHAPLVLTHGDGGRVWDVDGNEYVDMVCGLLPVVLGYRDPDVDAAIRAQLDRGISFSLPTPLEADLAERLVEIIPCAEKVRFGKNGTDATSAAIRLARAHTRRDRIAVAGYHGWQDWYIGSTTRDLGVPGPVKALTHRFAFNDLDSLHALFKAHPGEFAAVILEPMTAEEPTPGYFAELAEMVRDAGALLVFDEIITGFRYDLGGAQALFGVTPDLAAFGKSMANGMPISAILGRADVMDLMEEIFFSATFGGEALSLAAAIATIDKMRREPVIPRLYESGRILAEGAAARIAKHDLGEVVGLSGRDPWKLLVFRDHPTARKEAIKTLFMGRMYDHGVLIAASHNVCYAHSDIDLRIVLDAWDAALGAVREGLDTGELEKRLEIPVVEPLFRVR